MIGSTCFSQQLGVSTEDEEGEERTQGYRSPALYRLSLEKVLHPLQRLGLSLGSVPPACEPHIETVGNLVSAPT